MKTQSEKKLVIEKIDVINEILMHEVPDMNNIGLLNGKTGVSIYFFHLARISGSEAHQRMAERLIDEVLEGISRSHLREGFEDGLTGIAWGIQYLVKKGFVDVEGSRETLLSDVNDQIYRYITAADQLPIGIMRGAMGYMLYILQHLQEKGKRTETQVHFFLKDC